MARLMRVLNACGISYEWYRILEYQGGTSLSLGSIVIAEFTDPQILQHDPALQSLIGYAGPEAAGFMASLDGSLAAACWYWYGERYKTRRFISLPERGAKLVHIITVPAFRGRGIAPVLIAESSRQMVMRGFTPLWARVWHSNAASLAAFRKAGWITRETVIGVQMPGLTRPLRYRFTAVPQHVFDSQKKA